MIHTVFSGKQLHELELSDVKQLLDDAKAEPLQWEAKGIDGNPGEVHALADKPRGWAKQ